MAEQCPLCRQAPLCPEETFISPTYPYCLVGLYRTSFLVRKSGKFLKLRLSGNRTFSLLDAGLFKHYKNKKKNQKFFFHFFFSIFYIFFFMWSKISWHQICVQGQKYKSWFSPVQQDLSVLGIYNFGTLFLSFMWSSATLHPLRCDFSKKNTHSLDSDSDSWFLSQAEIIITVVWPYDKTKQIYKMTNFIQNGLKKLFGVKTVVILRICSILLSKHYSTVSHLFCTLISENQGLEKLRSVSNLRKISGPAQLNFFQYTWIFFRFIP